MITSKIDPALKEGYTARPAEMGDAKAATEMINIFTMQAMGTGNLTLKELLSDWSLPNFHPEENTRLVFSPEGQAAGYVEVWLDSEVPVHPYVWGCVHPAFEGRGIGSHLLAWALQRAHSALARVPEGARVSVYAHAVGGHQPSQRLLQEAGLQPIRHSYRMLIEMDAPPPAPRWPQGIRVRTADPERELEAVYRADEEAFRDHFGHVEEPFESGFQRFEHMFRNDDAYDPGLWFLALDGGEIAGFALCRKWSHESRDHGHVMSLGVRRPWRRRGIGLALLRHAFGEFYRRGYRKVDLGVDASNLTGALRLYEKAGMRVHRRFDLYELELRPGEELSTVTLDGGEEG